MSENRRGRVKKNRKTDNVTVRRSSLLEDQSSKNRARRRRRNNLFFHDFISVLAHSYEHLYLDLTGTNCWPNSVLLGPLIWKQIRVFRFQVFNKLISFTLSFAEIKSIKIEPSWNTIRIGSRYFRSIADIDGSQLRNDTWVQQCVVCSNVTRHRCVRC